MARRSLEERIADVDERADTMEREGTAQPTEVHRLTVDVFAQLLTMGKQFSGDEVPTHLRVLLKTLDRSRPLLEQELATVPEAELVRFMTMIGDQIDRITGAASAAPREETA